MAAAAALAVGFGGLTGVATHQGRRHVTVRASAPAPLPDDLPAPIGTTTSLTTTSVATPVVTAPPVTTPTTVTVKAPLPRPTTTTTVFGRRAAVDAPGLYIVNRDGSDIRRLATQAYAGSWSPDGRRIAFMNATGTYIVGLDGHTVKVSSLYPRRPPSWSPDSTRVAFTSPPAGGTSRDVWIAPADGSTPARSLVTPDDEADVDWGPDGRLAAMGQFGLDVIDQDLTTRHRVHADPLNYGEVRWSADAKTILAIPDSEAGHILVAADGSGERPLATPGSEDRVDAGTFSPDSRQVVYSGYARTQGQYGTMIAPNADGPARFVSTQLDFPRWAPTGDLIAGRDVGPGMVHIIDVMAPDGSGLRQVAVGVGSLIVSAPEWSHDGRQLTFAATSSS